MSRTALCHLFGITRQTGYKWTKRFARFRDWKAIEELSRRPHRSPNSTPKRQVKYILTLRRQHPRWGPIVIRERLRKAWPWLKWPVPSTVGAILKRHGLVQPRELRRRLPPRTKPFARCREPNDLWCVDFKGHFPTGDGRVCYPLTVMDGATRYLFACTAFHSPTLENVRGVFVELFRNYGLPKAIRSDNGEPFVAVGAAGGLSRLSAWWARLGIQLERIDPGKPQQNGRHERMHLTLKIETCSPPRSTLGWQQRAFDRFRRVYNEERPHQALELRTPASLYEPSPRRMGDSDPKLHYPFSDRYQVAGDGTILWGRRRLFISSALAGEIVGINHLDGRYTQVAYAEVVLGFIDGEQLHLGLQRPKVRWLKKLKGRLSAISPV